MNLQKISKVKTAMEDMMSKIDNLQEIITDDCKDERQVEIATESYKSQIKELYLTLIDSVSKKYSEKIIEREKGLIILRSLVSMCSGISEEELSKNTVRRKRVLVLPRQVHMAFAFKTFGMIQADAGRLYDKDHATALYGAKTVRNLWQTDKIFREVYSPVFEHCFQHDAKSSKTTTIDFLNSE
jgi:hypothetical protein